MSLIAKAHAQAIEMTAPMAPPPGMAPPGAPSATEAFLWNMGLVGVLVVLFYVLLIMPQQRRFKAHGEMLAGLKKGDLIVTAGGLVGKIDKISEKDPNVTVDLGNGIKVTAQRTTLQKQADAGTKASTPPVKAESKEAEKPKKAKK